MKPFVCEMCGGKQLRKQDGVFVCQNCGCQYTVEEARKLMIEGSVDVSGSKVDVSGSTVRVDTATELANLYQIARRARDDNNMENAARYYDMILIKDPKSWEAAFYVVSCKALQCKIIEIRSAANSVSNCLSSVLTLVCEHVSQDLQSIIVLQILMHCALVANVLITGAAKHYGSINYSIKSKYTQEYIDNVSAAVGILRTCGDEIDSQFSDQEEIAASAAIAWKKAVEIHRSVLSRQIDHEEDEQILFEYEEKIGKYDRERWERFQNYQAEIRRTQEKRQEEQREAKRQEMEKEREKILSEIRYYKSKQHMRGPERLALMLTFGGGMFLLGLLAVALDWSAAVGAIGLLCGAVIMIIGSVIYGGVPSEQQIRERVSYLRKELACLDESMNALDRQDEQNERPSV